MKANLRNASACLAILLLAAGTSFAGQGMSDSKESTTSTQQMQQAPSMTQARASQDIQLQVQASSDLQDFSVRDSQGNEVGEVNEVVLDLNQGQVGYLVVSSQGGEEMIVPWNAVTVNQEQRTLSLSVDQERINQAPKAQVDQLSDRQQAQEIHQFYGVSPYWEEAGQQQESQYGLPAGHPPVRGDEGRVDPPPSGRGGIPPAHPSLPDELPMADELPPGHPPVDSQ